MELTEVLLDREKKDFIRFIYSLYKRDRCYKDTLITTAKTFLYQRDTLSRQAYVRAVAVKDGLRTVAQCMYIYHSALPVLQIGYFDALPGQEEAVELILDEARRECRTLGLSRIAAGVNGHVRYGVGILTDSFGEPIPFDSLYNKPYYAAYFEQRGFIKSTLTEYAFDLAKIRFSQRVLDRVYSAFTFRCMRMNDFQNEMLLFGKLCNQTLRQTELYFDSDPRCFYELMSELKPFLRPEHLIFVMKDGREVGFLFWHPDYNEVIPGGRRNSMAGIGIRYFLNKSRIRKVKVNAMGVLGPYKGTGAVMGLINEARKATGAFTSAESNFVWDSNTDSSKLNRLLCNREARHYAVYYIPVQGGPG